MTVAYKSGEQNVSQQAPAMNKMHCKAYVIHFLSGRHLCISTYFWDPWRKGSHSSSSIYINCVTDMLSITTSETYLFGMTGVYRDGRLICIEREVISNVLKWASSAVNISVQPSILLISWVEIMSETQSEKSGSDKIRLQMIVSHTWSHSGIACS